jgi:hypothetical protein
VHPTEGHRNPQSTVIEKIKIPTENTEAEAHRAQKAERLTVANQKRRQRTGTDLSDWRIVSYFGTNRLNSSFCIRAILGIIGDKGRRRNLRFSTG